MQSQIILTHNSAYFWVTKWSTQNNTMGQSGTAWVGWSGTSPSLGGVEWDMSQHVPFCPTHAVPLCPQCVCKIHFVYDNTLKIIYCIKMIHYLNNPNYKSKWEIKINCPTLPQQSPTLPHRGAKWDTFFHSVNWSAMQNPIVTEKYFLFQNKAIRGVVY